MPKHAPKGKIKGQPMQDGHPMQRLNGRCTATARNRHTGQCKQSAIPGGSVCRFHGGKAPQVQEAAMARLLRLQSPAIDTLSFLMDQRETFPSTAYAAARDVLDRTEGKAIETVKQEHSGAVVIKWEGE